MKITRAIIRKIGHYPIVDHWAIKNNVLTLEPYIADMEDFERLINFCKENDLEFGVIGSSPYNPGHTFMVIITPKNELGKYSQNKKGELERIDT